MTLPNIPHIRILRQVAMDDRDIWNLHPDEVIISGSGMVIVTAGQWPKIEEQIIADLDDLGRVLMSSLNANDYRQMMRIIADSDTWCRGEGICHDDIVLLVDAGFTEMKSVHIGLVRVYHD